MTTATATVNVTLKPEDMREVLSAAILQHLTPERRDELIKSAVGEMLRREQGSKTSPLEDAMRYAVRNIITSQIEQRLLVDETFKAEQKKLWEEAWARFTGSKETREKLVERMVNALEGAMFGSRY